MTNTNKAHSHTDLSTTDKTIIDLSGGLLVLLEHLDSCPLCRGVGTQECHVVGDLQYSLRQAYLNYNTIHSSISSVDLAASSLPLHDHLVSCSICRQDGTQWCDAVEKLQSNLRLLHLNAIRFYTEHQGEQNET
jgi:hypothetical protein